MNSITEFEREFTCVMRGYSPREVSEAIDMLISYGAELESANAEFAEVNDALVQQNDAAAAEIDRLRSENAALREEGRVLREELENSRAGLAEARQRTAEANARVENMRADAESALGQIIARCDAEEKRYAALSRKTAALTEAVRALYAEHMQGIDALIEANSASDETPAVSRPAVRRAIMEATAVSPEPEEPEVQPPHAIPRAPRRQVAPVPRTESPAEPEAAADPVAEPAGEAEEMPTRRFSVPTETVTVELESAQVDTVYRPAKPSAIKVIRDGDTEKTPTHSFAAVRRTLDEIGSKLQ